MKQLNIIFEFAVFEALNPKISLKINSLPNIFPQNMYFIYKTVEFSRHFTENSPLSSQDPRKPRIISKSAKWYIAL